VLQQWMMNESGYPANWKEDLKKTLHKQTIAIVPAGSGVAEMKAEYGRGLRILAWVCGLVLLIACANVANLLLVRSVARRGQVAVRLAVGASRREIILQALTESVLLAIGGGIAGLFIAMGAARMLLGLAFSVAKYLPISVTPSLPVLGFAFAVSLLTGVIFGAGPAWMATRTDPAEALRSQGRKGSDRSSSLNKVLLILQATLSVVLVAGATMLGRSLDNMQHQNFGYPAQGRVLVSLNSPPGTYSIAKLQDVYRRLETRLKSLPGVRGGGIALYNPLTNNWSEMIMVAGHPPSKMDTNSGASWDRVTPTYLHDLGMKMVRGREFSEADNENSEPVAIVNETFARRFFTKDEDPLRQHFGLDLPELAGTYRVIGVVNDARFAGFGFRQPVRPMFYVPAAQLVHYSDVLMARLETGSHFLRGLLLETGIAPGTLEPALRRALAEVDPNLTVVSVRRLSDQIALTFDQERSVASLAGLFGVVALLLAAVGMYGVTAYSVARRTAEIGIRMALGADRSKVVRMVLQGASNRVLLGLLAGIPLAILGGRLMSTELYQVASWDPPSLGTATVALAVSAFFAAIIPANRAASISPVNALRAE
jgi:predicted permease